MEMKSPPQAHAERENVAKLPGASGMGEGSAKGSPFGVRIKF